jgi:hypothetical protein
MTERNPVREAFAAKYPALDAEVALGENNPDYRGLEDIRGRHALSHFRAGWQAAIASRGCLDDDCPELCSLKDSYGQLLAENVAQRAEIAQLREDAERYRWLRAQHWDEAPIACVANPKEAIKLGHDCPSLERLDAAIDAQRKTT